MHVSAVAHSPNVCVYTVYICHTSRKMLKQTEWTKNNTDECRFVYSFPFESHYTWLIWRRFEARRSWFAAKETKQRERDGHSICMLHSWVGAHPKDPQEPHLYTLTGIKQDCKSVCCQCSDMGKPSDSGCLHQKKLFWGNTIQKKSTISYCKSLIRNVSSFPALLAFHVHVQGKAELSGDHSAGETICELKMLLFQK